VTIYGFLFEIVRVSETFPVLIDHLIQIILRHHVSEVHNISFILIVFMP